ncbi:MAG: aspartate 1-decarboxylase [Gammaproteobacteria bacterium]|nr:aspartate 1-decarboxylase [Gammaproteobacteria bacterium]
MTSVNGAAAHKASPGGRVIICAYASLSQQELVNFKPPLIYFDEHGRITHSRNSIPLQVA